MARRYGYSGFTIPRRNRDRDDEQGDCDDEYYSSPNPYSRNTRTESPYSTSRRPAVSYRQSPSPVYSPQPRRSTHGTYTYGRSSFIDSPRRPSTPRRLDDSDYDADHSDQWSDSAARRPARFGGYGFNSTLRGSTQYGRSRFQTPPAAFTYDNSGAEDSGSEYSGEVPYQRRGRSPAPLRYSSSPTRTQRSFWGSPDRDRSSSRATRSVRVFRPPSPVRRMWRSSPPPRQQNNPLGRRRSVRDDDSFGDRASGTSSDYSPSPPRRNTGVGRFTTYTRDDPIRSREITSRQSGGWSDYFRPTRSSQYRGYW